METQMHLERVDRSVAQMLHDPRASIGGGALGPEVLKVVDFYSLRSKRQIGIDAAALAAGKEIPADAVDRARSARLAGTEIERQRAEIDATSDGIVPDLKRTARNAKCAVRKEIVPQRALTKAQIRDRVAQGQTLRVELGLDVTGNRNIERRERLQGWRGIGP